MAENDMLNKVMAAVMAASLVMGGVGTAAAADATPTPPERKAASPPKAKKPVKATPKPKAVQGKKIPRVEEAPDFRA